jgi:hypothetical protein
MPALPPKIPQAYDVCFYVNSRPFLRKLEHGVTLDSDAIAWTADGSRTEMAFGFIVAINLKSTGSRVIVEQCAITFADNNVLTIVNSGAGGYSDSERAAAYRDFVRELHVKLAGSAYGGIRFSAGVPRGRYLATLALTTAVTVVCVVFGLVEYLMTRDLHGLGLILLGGYLGWRLGRKALANAPRDYTPDRLPDALLS